MKEFMFFKSQEGKSKVLDLYDQKLEQLKIEKIEKIVQTKYGATNIIITGDAEKPALLLIHGTGGCAPLILESFPKLSSKYCVYAIDVLAQPNKSAENRLDMKTLDYGKWLIEIILQLGLDSVTLVGFSFGGLISLKTLEYDEKLIKKVILIAPVYLVNGDPVKNLFQVFFPLKSFIKTGKEQKIKKVLKALFSEYDSFTLNFMSATFKNCNMDFSPLPILSKKNAYKITTPITLCACEDDIMFPCKKLVKRAKRILPSLEKIVILENSKHVPNKMNFNKIETILLNNLI